MRVSIAWTERGSAPWRSSRWTAEAMLQQSMARTMRVSIAWTELMRDLTLVLDTLSRRGQPRKPHHTLNDQNQGIMVFGSAYATPSVGNTTGLAHILSLWSPLAGHM